MIPAITAWLEQAEPDFNTGFSLFCQYSPNRTLISWIGRKQDLEMLRYELRKLNPYLTAPAAANAETLAIEAKASPDPAAHAAPKTEKRPEKSEPAPDPGPKIVFDTYDERRTRRADLPPELQQLYDDIAGDYKVRRALHEKMKAALSDADRASFRARILECQERITAGWKRIDAHLYETTTRQVEDSFNEKSCRAYISKGLKEESLSPKRRDGIRIRVKALLEHGCTLADETLRQLRERDLL